MKNVLVLLVCVVAMTFVFAGCNMPTGTVAAQVMVAKAPGEFYDGSVGTSKRGEAVVTGILLVAYGDGTIPAAMSNGGITKLQRIEYDYFNVLGIYSKKTTIAYGE